MMFVQLQMVTALKIVIDKPAVTKMNTPYMYVYTHANIHMYETNREKFQTSLLTKHHQKNPALASQNSEITGMCHHA